MATKPSVPNLAREERLWHNGLGYVAGVDEAGRGALAGPVVAGAVIVPWGSMVSGVWGAVRDSKALRPAQRERLSGEVQEAALAWGVGTASAAEIDDVGIGAATRRAMARAIRSLAWGPDVLLIDWVRLPGVDIRQECWARADQTSVSVAAASILAKVHRDHILDQLAHDHPGYGFAENKGYGTRMHLEALARLGPCPQHRRSFAPVAVRLTLFNA